MDYKPRPIYGGPEIHATGAVRVLGKLGFTVQHA
jgi:hypothetical protein